MRKASATLTSMPVICRGIAHPQVHADAVVEVDVERDDAAHDQEEPAKARRQRGGEHQERNLEQLVVFVSAHVQHEDGVHGEGGECGGRGERLRAARHPHSPDRGECDRGVADRPRIGVAELAEPRDRQGPRHDLHERPPAHLVHAHRRTQIPVDDPPDVGGEGRHGIATLIEHAEGEPHVGDRAPQEKGENRRGQHRAERGARLRDRAQAAVLPQHERQRRAEKERLGLGGDSQRHERSSPHGAPMPGERERRHRGQREQRIHVPQHFTAEERGRIQPVCERSEAPHLLLPRHAPRHGEQQPGQSRVGEQDRKLHRDEQRQRVGIVGKERAVRLADEGVFVQEDGRVLHRAGVVAPRDQAARRRRPAHAVHARQVLGGGIAPELPHDDIVVAGQGQRREPQQQSQADDDQKWAAAHAAVFYRPAPRLSRGITSA